MASADIEAPPPPAQSTSPAAIRPSPFFHTPPTTSADSLAILHLKRDSLLPLSLRATADDGYAEGAVTNTRFGSFPHSTLIGLAWGSQVRASRVDTGTRGRKGKFAKAKDVPVAEDLVDEGKHGKKRKSDDAVASDEQVAKKARQAPLEDTCGDQATVSAADDGAKGKKRKSDTAIEEIAPAAKKLKQAQAALPEAHNGEPAKAPVEAGSGFIHILPPTPEAWTSSLDHRTQVVYTPDYSYILQRLRIRPGDTVIEAGAGSGSFTHAAARAVFNGYDHVGPGGERGRMKTGKVYSFEYHEPRVQTLRQELCDHGLNGTVQLTHRDVCNHGFTLAPEPASASFNPTSTKIKANAIFLDLPSPHLALKHLTRSASSPLNPNTPVHLCTFSPCIEQVITTTNVLRKTGWTEIQMVEVQHRRLDVRREHTSLKFEGLRGVQASAASVEEAVGRLREVEANLSAYHSTKPGVESNGTEDRGGAGAKKAKGGGKRVESKQQRLKRVKEEAESRQMWKEGRLVVRSEQEVKTHTSYLVFAVLPREWNEEDEGNAMARWPVDELMKMKPDDEVPEGRDAGKGGGRGKEYGNSMMKKNGSGTKD